MTVDVSRRNRVVRKPARVGIQYLSAFIHPVCIRKVNAVLLVGIAKRVNTLLNPVWHEYIVGSEVDNKITFCMRKCEVKRPAIADILRQWKKFNVRKCAN